MASSGKDCGDSSLTLRKNSGAEIGSRPCINLIEGANITISVVDDSVGDEFDVTITGSAGGIGGSTGPTDNQALRSDGTGGATAQSSGVEIQDNTLAKFVGVASAVNGVQITPAIAGGIPRVGSYGSDSAVYLYLEAKGNSGVVIRVDNSDRFAFDTSGFTPSTSGRFRLTLSAPSATNPNIQPNESDGNTGIGWAGSDQLSLIAGALEVLRAASGLGSATGPVLFLPNLTTPPSVNPVGGVYLYVEAGALKARGSSGTVTTLAPA